MVLLCYAGSSLSFDRYQELEWAEALVATAEPGEVWWLETESLEILSLYREADAQPHGAVIVLHDAGRHPDWRGVIQAVRTGLPSHGWATLSVQMPSAEPQSFSGRESSFLQEGEARIAAAFEFLQKKGYERIVLLGHGWGAAMALAYLGVQPASRVQALVAIGLSIPQGDIRNRLLNWLGTLTVPVLDLYAEYDLKSVVDTADARKRAGEHAPSPQYRQVILPGTDHEFAHSEAALVMRIHSWLVQSNRQAGATTKNKK